MTLSRRATVLILLVFAVGTVRSQPASLYEVRLDDRIDQSDMIVEARVADQEAFWSQDGTRIYTASVLDVYRVFRGETESGRVEIVTPGGRIGHVAQQVLPSLRLDVGDVGVFLGQAMVGSGATGKTGLRRYSPVASVQGMIRYDEIRGSASDAFTFYGDIEGDLHAAIAMRTGVPEVIRRYNVPLPPDRRLPKTGVAPSISSISPGTVTAGNDVVLTISGSGFEAYDGGTNSNVFFPNADNGGVSLTNAPSSLVVAWSDTQIQVRVPSGAGTGAVTVRTASGLQATSAMSLAVQYNLVNLLVNDNLRRTSLASKVGGGYSMRFSTSTADNGVSFASSPAVAPFERALLSWQRATGLNVRADGADIDSNRVAPNSLNDIVTFESDADPIPSGVLGRAHTGFISCDGNTWIVQGMDVQFRRDGNSVTWNFGPDANSGNRADFESVALHELGHAHQLGHVVAPGKVMHYAITNGTDVRILDGITDVAGGDDAIDYAQSLNTSCGGRLWTGMVRLVGVGTEPEVLARSHSLSEAYPNPAPGSTTFTLSVEDTRPVTIDVFDMLGRRVARVFEGVLPPGVEHEFVFRGDHLPDGLYFYTASGVDFRTTRKVVMLN